MRLHPLALGLLCSAVFAQVPGPHEVPVDSGAGSPFDWRYEGAAVGVYVALFVVAALLPERWRWFTLPIALLWPCLVWVGIWLKG